MNQKFTIAITNEGPQKADRNHVAPPLLEAFLAMMPEDGRDRASPYEHQATAFDYVLANHEMRMVAGTAAGKTLGIAIPVFDKLFRQKQIHKALFLYPTLALLEDQRRTLDGLLNYYVQQHNAPKKAIGLIRGGLPRTRLLRELSKPIIVATPDAVYWFFRKNVKYNDFLIYGLIQADEIVIDEAHLFTGLMHRNMVHFLNRLRFLRGTYLGRKPRVHYLTATEANEELRALSPDSVPVPGKSKCGTVTLTIEEYFPPWEREERFTELVTECLELGKRRILVVTNSARRAHRLFEVVRDARKSAPHPDVPTEFWQQFGIVGIGAAVEALAGLDPEMAEHVRDQARRELGLSIKDAPPEVIRLRPDYCASESSAWLTNLHRELRNAIYRYAREAGEDFSGRDLHDMLEIRGWSRERQMLGLRLRQSPDRDTALAHLDAQVTAVSEWLDSGWSEAGANGGVSLSSLDAAGFQAVIETFRERSETVPDMLIRALAHYLARALTLDADSLADVERLDFQLYARRRLSLRRLLHWIEDDGLCNQLTEILVASAQPAHRTVGVLRDDSRGTLVILYSGSMARYMREGLIELFGHPDLRPPAVLIATQAVEVGVDFDADTLITEESSGSSFLQRFGRVGRQAQVKSDVHLLVGPEAYDALNQVFADQEEIERDNFSESIGQIFREPAYIEASRYVDAIQRVVSLQLGQVGQAHLEAIPDPAADLLLRQLRQAGIEPAYGLRGTLPGVALRDAGVSKDPFYVLRYVPDSKLVPTDSPFESAKAEVFFNEIIFKSPFRIVVVDVEKTLARSQAIALPTGDSWQVVSDDDGHDSPAHYYRYLARQYGSLPLPLRRKMLEQFTDLPTAALDAPHLLLVYGDIYLLGADYETGDVGTVVGNEGPVILSNQWYLVLLGLTHEEDAQAWLEEQSAADFDSEIYYDFDALESNEHPGTNDVGLVLVERQAGAAWEMWLRLRKVER